MKPAAIHPLPRRLQPAGARAVDQLCQQTRRMRALTRLETASGGDWDRLLQSVCMEAPSLFKADAAAVLVDEGDGLLRVHAATGFGEPFVSETAIPTADVDGLGATPTEALHLGRPEAGPISALLEDDLTAALVAPLRCRGELRGLLLVGLRTTGLAFGEEDGLFAEVLGMLLGGRLSEALLQRNLQRLQRALWETARRLSPASGPNGPTEPAPSRATNREPEALGVAPARPVARLFAAAQGAAALLSKR